ATGEPTRRERYAFGERERCEARETPRQRTAQRHDAHRGDVAFQERVRRLRRRVRDERDRRGLDAVLAQQGLEPADDPGGDAVGMIVRRRHLHRRHHLAGRRIHGDDVRERAAHVDPDPQPGSLARPARQLVPAFTVPSTSSTRSVACGKACSASMSPRRYTVVAPYPRSCGSRYASTTSARRSTIQYSGMRARPYMRSFTPRSIANDDDETSITANASAAFGWRSK